jgi:hypothetical protein
MLKRFVVIDVYTGTEILGVRCASKRAVLALFWRLMPNAPYQNVMVIPR